MKIEAFLPDLQDYLRLFRLKNGGKNMRKVRFKDVVFTKCHDFNSFGEYKPFWRADLYGQTIATLCDTKAECVAEVRNYLKKRKEENYEY